MSTGLETQDGRIQRALVTGGAGFLGSAIVRELLEHGVEVTIASRSAARAKVDEGIHALSLDLTDAPALVDAASNMDAIFHVAARAGVWGRRKDYFDTNVLGTRNVIAAALANGVPRLIHTSSPSVCFDGRDHIRAGNDLPHARRYLCSYPETKAISERELLAAHGRQGVDGTTLATCALRPHLIVGPGDPHFLPRLIDSARAKKLAVIGDGQNEVGLTDVINAAHAHLCAARALGPNAACGGQAYFVTQEEPVLIWEWLARLFESIDVPLPTRRFSRRKACAIGAVCEALWRALPLAGDPPMTRFVALQLASSHTYDMHPARRDLGYRERVSTAELTERVYGAARLLSTFPRVADSSS